MSYKPLVSEQPQGQTQFTDRLFIDKLAAIRNFEIRKGDVFLQGLTSGLWANTYVISDLDRMTEVLGRPEDKVPTPVFMVQENSGCCARLCCPGHQSFTAKVYHAMPQPQAGETWCGCYSGHKYRPDVNAGVPMTLEREGCCGKWLGCFACTECCLEDMIMHVGDRNIDPGQTAKLGSNDYFARGRMPQWGGGCTPTVNLATATRPQFATVEGPSCYGGWLSLCFDTIFYFSSQPGKAGDFGTVAKRKAEGCGDVCREFYTHNDQYEFRGGPAYQALTTEERAALLGEVVHIDFMFFENDLPPCYVRREGNNSVMVCTLCQMYCYGCCCPVQVVVPLKGK